MANSSSSSGSSGRETKTVNLGSYTIFTPAEASQEYGILLNKIITKLEKNKDYYLKLIQDMCSCLTANENSSILFFSREQQIAINACSSIKTLFTVELREYCRWYDLSFLKKILQSIEKPRDRKKYTELLDKYKQKIDIHMKLQKIQENCQHMMENLPEGFLKMVAIVQNKIFYQVTLEEYIELQKFISENCDIDPIAMTPLNKMDKSSLLLEWSVPSTVESHMIRAANMNANIFIRQNFICLKISSTVIFDKRDNVS